jgi:flagellar biogenesis protein FliO
MRFTPSLQRGGRISVVERFPLSPKVLLLVVKVGEEYLLLAIGANSVTLLKDLGPDWEDSGRSGGEEIHNNGDGNNNYDRKVINFEDILGSMRNKFFGRK